jgi:hypothetical protein
MAHCGSAAAAHSGGNGSCAARSTAMLPVTDTKGATADSALCMKVLISTPAADVVCRQSRGLAVNVAAALPAA